GAHGSRRLHASPACTGPVCPSGPRHVRRRVLKFLRSASWSAPCRAQPQTPMSVPEEHARRTRVGLRPAKPNEERVMAKIALPPLALANDGLAPHISSTTIETHYGTHHRNYVNKTIELLGGDANRDLEAVVREAAADPAKKTLFNNAGQIWNHNRYWESLS